MRGKEEEKICSGLSARIDFEFIFFNEGCRFFAGVSFLEKIDLDALLHWCNREKICVWYECMCLCVCAHATYARMCLVYSKCSP